MIRWCSYCQQFIGETKPFDNYGITHGMCESCKDKFLVDDESMIDKSRSLMRYFAELRKACYSGDWLKVKGLIGTAEKENIAPIDLCFGMIQPFLYEIGYLWSQARITVADEHKFTALCSSVIEMFFTMYPQHQHLRQSESPQVLLVNTEDNYHVLGIRMVEFMLMLNGVSTYTIFPGIPVNEILSLIKKLNPPNIGISVSLLPQMKSVRELLILIKSDSINAKVYVGGQAVREGMANAESFNINIITNVKDFLSNF